MRFTLDSWAVLRLLEGAEPAASRVEQVLEAGRPVMSWINVGEVFSVVRRERDEHRMAYADAFAAATAAAHRATLLTGVLEPLVDDVPWRWEDLRTQAERERSWPSRPRCAVPCLLPHS